MSTIAERMEEGDREQFLMRAQCLGERAAQCKEKLILEKILEREGEECRKARVMTRVAVGRGIRRSQLIAHDEEEHRRLWEETRLEPIHSIIERGKGKQGSTVEERYLDF